LLLKPFEERHEQICAGKSLMVIQALLQWQNVLLTVTRFVEHEATQMSYLMRQMI